MLRGVKHRWRCRDDLLPSGLSANRVSLALGVVEDEVALAFIHNHRHVCTAAPTVCHDAIWSHRIRSCEFGRLDIVAVYADEELRSEISFAIEGEPPHCCKVPNSDNRSRSVKSVAAMKGRIRTI